MWVPLGFILVNLKKRWKQLSTAMTTADNLNADVMNIEGFWKSIYKKADFLLTHASVYIFIYVCV